MMVGDKYDNEAVKAASVIYMDYMDLQTLISVVLFFQILQSFHDDLKAVAINALCTVSGLSGHPNKS